VPWEVARLPNAKGFEPPKNKPKMNVFLDVVVNPFGFKSRWSRSYSSKLKMEEFQVLPPVANPLNGATRMELEPCFLGISG